MGNADIEISLFEGISVRLRFIWIGYLRVLGICLLNLGERKTRILNFIFGNKVRLPMLAKKKN